MEAEPWGEVFGGNANSVMLVLSTKQHVLSANGLFHGFLCVQLKNAVNGLQIEDCGETWSQADPAPRPVAPAQEGCGGASATIWSNLGYGDQDSTSWLSEDESGAAYGSTYPYNEATYTYSISRSQLTALLTELKVLGNQKGSKCPEFGGLSTNEYNNWRVHYFEDGYEGGSGVAGADINFTVSNARFYTAYQYTVTPPVVSTHAASNIGETSATLSGTVNPEGSEVTKCIFEYGPTTAYGASVPCAKLPGSGASPVEVTAALAGVAPGTTYDFRLVATNSRGTEKGNNQELSTLVPPSSYSQSIDSGQSLNAVSCISGTTDCVVSDSGGKALYSTNVSYLRAATWSSWSGPSGKSPSQAVACPSTSLCLLADGHETSGGNLYYASSLGGSFTNAFERSLGVDAISCASSSFCVAGQDGEGYFRYSTNPASGSWTQEQQGTAAMTSVFCLSASFCAIADADGHVHIATSESQVKSSSWKETDVDGTSALHGISCTTTSECVAVDGAGNVLNLSISGEGVATVTKHDVDGSNDFTAVTCTSSTCVAVDSKGNIFSSAKNGESFTETYSFGDDFTGVSCASASLCVATDTTGNVRAFYSPPARESQLIDGAYLLDAVSCISGTTDCVVSDSGGKALYSTNVSYLRAATWSSWSGPSGKSPSQAVACPSTSLCLLADGHETSGGNLYYASSLGGSFTNAFERSLGVDAISCASSSFCVAGQDGEGYFRYSTNPASGSWTQEQQGTAAMTSVFCLSASFCAIADADGHVHIATSESQVKSSSWKETDVDGTSALHGISCTTTSECVAVDGAGNVLNLSISGEGVATVTKHDVDGSNDFTAVTCTSSTCVAVDSKGNIFSSAKNGESFTETYSFGDDFTGVSCASASLCVATDTTGNVRAFYSPPARESQLIDGAYLLDAVSCISGTTDCVVSDSGGKALYSTNVSYLRAATWSSWSGPSGKSPSQAVACPSTSLCLLADGHETSGGNLYYASSLGGSFTNAFEPSLGVDAISCASSSFCVAGQDGEGYFRYSTNPASGSWTQEQQGTAAMTSVFCLSASFCAIADADGHVHIATSESQVKSSSWKETDVDGTSALHGISCTTTSECV